MAAQVDIPKTFGAVLLGGLFAIGLSGIVTVQVIVYYKMYPVDHARLKALVLGIWILDLFHSGFIMNSIWTYLITNYGNNNTIDDIPWSIPMTIVFTAVLTFSVHCFFSHRIYMLSQKNLWLTCPILVLAVFRLTCACVTTAEMLRMATLTEFKREFRWVFTLGLALSSSVDVVITILLFFLLQTKRTGSTSLNRIIDSLMLYAFETGSLTCAATIASMICWLAMSNNLVFLGLHFVISKLYANSLLVTLNTREKLRRSRSGSGDNVLVLGTRHLRSRDQYSPNVISSSKSTTRPGTPALQINVEKSIQYTTDVHGPLDSMG